MYLSDANEVKEVLNFFKTHLGRELHITITVFDGLSQMERVKVQEVEAHPPRILLSVVGSQRKLAIDPHHFSFTTVSPDHSKLEIGRILGANLTFRLMATEPA